VVGRFRSAIGHRRTPPSPDSLHTSYERWLPPPTIFSNSVFFFYTPFSLEAERMASLFPPRSPEQQQMKGSSSMRKDGQDGFLRVRSNAPFWQKKGRRPFPPYKKENKLLEDENVPPFRAEERCVFPGKRVFPECWDCTVYISLLRRIKNSSTTEWTVVLHEKTQLLSW